MSLRDRFGSPVPHILSSGFRCTSPFVAPVVDGALIFGLGDFAAVQQAMAATPAWPPIVLVDEAKRRSAAVCLWLSEFQESTAGSYRELTVTFLVADHALELPMHNALSPVAAQLHPEVVVCEYVLVLDQQAAIEYGRELHGFDKHPGFVELTFTNGKTKFRVEECPLGQRGGLALEGEIADHDDAMTQAQMLRDLARSYGLLPTARLLLERDHKLRVCTPTTIVSRRSDLYLRGRPSLQPWGAKDVLVAGDSPVGKLIAGLNFRPTAVQLVRHGEGVMPLPLD